MSECVYVQVQSKCFGNPSRLIHLFVWQVFNNLPGLAGYVKHVLKIRQLQHIFYKFLLDSGSLSIWLASCILSHTFIRKEYAYSLTQTHTYTYILIYIYICMCVCVCVLSVCVFIVWCKSKKLESVYAVYIYIYIYRPGGRIRQLYPCRGVRTSHNECPRFDTKPSDSEAPALEF